MASVVLPAALAVLFFLVPALGQSADLVSVEIGVVRASNASKDIDPALAEFKSKLQSMFSYSEYRMLDRKKKTLGIGESGFFDIPGDRLVRVTPSPHSSGKVRLSVQILDGDKSLLTTTLVMNPKSLVLVGGPPWQDGVIILFIIAE